MEQIKLLNNQTFFLVPYSGINQTNKELEIKLITDENLNNLNHIFSESENLKTIQVLSEEGQVVGILNNYINLKEISKQNNVFLYTKEIIIKNEEIIEEKESIYEENKIYEDIYGDLVIIKLNTMDIENTVKQLKEELETTQNAILELSEML